MSHINKKLHVETIDDAMRAIYAWLVSPATEVHKISKITENNVTYINYDAECKCGAIECIGIRKGVMIIQTDSDVDPKLN